MPKTIVVLPTYNEAENLPLMVDALLNLAVENLNILVVDDNSPDGTGKIAEDLATKHPGRITVMHRQEKNGLGPAYIAGFKKAISMEPDYIVQMDCDFSHQPKYVPQLIAAMENNDLVLGSRWIKGGSVDENWPFYRKLLSWFANRVYIPTILGIPVHDATGGFRCWRRQTLIGLDLDRIRSTGYIFMAEMIYVATRLGFRVSEVPIHFPDRTLGTSKMSVNIQVEAAMRVWQVMQMHHSLKPDMRRTSVYS